MKKQPAKTTQPSAKNKGQKQADRSKNSNSMLRLFSVFMLLLLALSSFGRIATANHTRPRASQAFSQETYPASRGTASAKVLVFHREDQSAGWCEDLVISAAGDAVYSNCGKGVEKQYTLSEPERQQLQTWIGKFRAVNYDQKGNNQAGGTRTQLYLNGQGSKAAAEADTRRMIDFAAAVDAEISSQS